MRVGLCQLSDSALASETLADAVRLKLPMLTVLVGSESGEQYLIHPNTSRWPGPVLRVASLQDPLSPLLIGGSVVMVSIPNIVVRESKKNPKKKKICLNSLENG